jgi:hypothetical protein
MNYILIIEIAAGVFIGGYMLLIIAERVAVKFEVRAYWRSIPGEIREAYSSESLAMRVYYSNRRKEKRFEIFSPEYKPKYLQEYQMEGFYQFFDKKGRFYGS